MNILIVDCTKDALAVIVVKNGAIFSNRCFAGARNGGESSGSVRHTVALLGDIDKLLNVAGLDVSNIDCFSAVIGPGSYTGIRVGVCAVNAMAKAGEKKLVAVDSLEILARGAAEHADAEGEGLVCLIDNGHDYYALKIDNGGRRYFICGKEQSKEFKNAVFFDKDADYTAQTVAAAAEKIERGQFEDFLKPFYMKKSQAGREFFDKFSDMPNAVL